MEKRKQKSFENIYQESNDKISNQDKIDVMTDFINKLKQIIHQGQFIIDNLYEKN